MAEHSPETQTAPGHKARGSSRIKGLLTGSVQRRCDAAVGAARSTSATEALLLVVAFRQYAGGA